MIPATGLTLLLLCGAGALHGAAGPSGPEERVARWLSPGFREGETRLAEIGRELADLPLLAPRPFASRYGFRSETLPDPDEEQWLQLDLGDRPLIDRIALVPAHIPSLGKAGEGYGFPLRFRIEISDDPEMQDSVTVIDRTAADVPNPGRYPLDLAIDPVRGRYLRITSTRHFPADEGFIWAIEELVALSGNRLLSTWETTRASSSLELYPNWAANRARDGQSALGLPVTPEPSPTRGYLSAITRDPKEEKWLRVDLGRNYRVDEVRLVPVESDNFQSLGERAFPRGLKMELATDPEFREVTWSTTMSRTNLVGFPGHCSLLMPTRGKRGRYLRLVTHELWGTHDVQGYGLAEIQAYSGDTNVALGQPVTASDEVDTGPGWSTAFATDGFSSRHRLIEWPDYLDRIARRGRLERERDTLLEQRAGKLRTTSLVLGYGGGTLGGLALCGWGWMLVRQRTSRRRAVSRLREQIARDLHDDIGSNLGAILLVSEIGSRHSDNARAREDFHTIKEAAEHTSQSMQDIIWLIERGNTRLRNLVSRLREVTELILGELHVTLLLDPPEFRDRPLSLFFRRHFFFAFKETLHNVRRHARAGTVDIRITTGKRELGFEVRDDGTGFDPKSGLPTGHGLANLQRRAARLGGSCHIESRPGAGTRVVFRAPIQKNK